MSLSDDLDRDGFCIARALYDYRAIRALTDEITLLGWEVSPATYEGAKQLPALYALIVSKKSLNLIFDLRPGFIAGVAEGGVQVRIDMPDDERWRTHWHQDGTFQGRSPDGLTFWTPLTTITPDLGPMEICVGSHKAGVLPIYDAGDVGGLGRTRSYTWEIEGVDDVVAGYEVVAPLTNPGDVIVMDYATIHRSGRNSSASARWSCLWRYFNMADPVGRAIGWKRPAQFGPGAA